MSTHRTARTRTLTTALLALTSLTACATAEEPAAPIAADAPAPTISTDPIPFSSDAPFASEIYNFFVQDELFPPSECRTVFTGSSSIRFWLTLDDDFPDLNPLNRGFGGSEITHLIGYFDILLSRHQPREIIFYAGENDLNAGASPADMVARFDVFMDMKTERLGDAPVYFLSVKPSYARLGELGAQSEANALIEAYAETRDDLIYVDIASPMMKGEVPKQIFISDELHMNLDGYAIWTAALRDILNNQDRPKRSGC